ncbi:chlorophyll A-B binding protein [Aureococcus anophagefferens]|uniref:Chlorophyll A-B binding protein n=1 Tax=Aureococcus anophagefferens TaxID=44056 RepID=A0ABR1G9T9_AURAN
MARLAFALAATCASTSALVAPTAAKASTSLNVATTSYDPSDFSDVTKLPGILAPVEFFDPLNFAADASESELKRYREAELTHGRVAMLASVGFLVGESGATPLFGGNIDGIAINQFWKVPTGFWPVILLFIAVRETFSALSGWMEPTVPENYFQLRSGYTPGDIDFDPLGLCPADAMEFKEMQTKAPSTPPRDARAAGMIVQSRSSRRAARSSRRARARRPEAPPRNASGGLLPLF